MKHLFLTLVLSLFIMNLGAQVDTQTCHFGITFEISDNPNWGYGEPVVLTVEPGSPAEIAGIKTGDIIMEINGAATYLRNYQTINSWLFDENSEIALFTIRNLNTYFKEYELPRRCRSIKSLDESNLASSFAFYSLEGTQDRVFTLPLKISANKDVDYSDYHTFNFIEDPKAPAVDNYITEQLEQALKAKGLIRTNVEPDFLIQTYYSYQPNKKYNPSGKQTYNGSWRYDVNSREMVLLPILQGDDLSAEYNGQFILNFGIRFFDKKFIDTEKLTQIWEGTVKDYLTAQMTLEEYVKLHLPLVVMQFPYSENREMVKFVASFKKYNYTGLCYDMDNMKTITDVDRNSPAYNAGLRPGMIIDRINKQKFTHSKNEILNGYKRFIVETMKYRDPSTRFTDANGFPDCMYWYKKDYGKISNAFKDQVYVPSFSYLYSFEKYVSGKSGEAISIETKTKVYNIRPEIKSTVSLRTL